MTPSLHEFPAFIVRLFCASLIVKAVMKKKTKLIAIALVVLGSGCQDEIPTSPRQTPIAQKLHYDLAAGNALRDQIENAAPGATITLTEPVYTLDRPIVIANKSGLTIQGNGPLATVIQTTADFSGVGPLQIGSNVSNLSIAHFSIDGSATPTDHSVHGIYTTGDPSNLSFITIQDLEIRDVGVGIAISADATNSCDAVTIFGNTFKRMRARLEYIPDQHVWATAGSGYGIDTGHCKRVWIARNYFEDTERHAIYQSNGPGPVTIEHNLIINHNPKRVLTTCGDWDDGGKVGCNQLTAIHVARSSHVYVAFNILLHPRTNSILVYKDDNPNPQPITDVQLIGNTIIGAIPGNSPAEPTVYDLHFVAASTYVLWGNRSYRAGAFGPSTALTFIDDAATGGGPAILTHPNWESGADPWVDNYSGNRGSLPSNLVFVRKDGQMHVLEKGYGTPPDSWNPANGAGPSAYWDNYDPFGMVGGTDRAYLWANGYLWNTRNPGSGWIHNISPSPWPGFKSMTFNEGFLYVMKNDVLTKVSSDLDSLQAYPTWNDSQGMVSFEGKLYIYIHNCVYELTAATLAYIRNLCGD